MFPLTRVDFGTVFLSHSHHGHLFPFRGREHLLSGCPQWPSYVKDFLDQPPLSLTVLEPNVVPSSRLSLADP